MVSAQLGIALRVETRVRFWLGGGGDGDCGFREQRILREGLVEGGFGWCGLMRVLRVEWEKLVAGLIGGEVGFVIGRN